MTHNDVMYLHTLFQFTSLLMLWKIILVIQDSVVVINSQTMKFVCFSRPARTLCEHFSMHGIGGLLYIHATTTNTDMLLLPATEYTSEQRTL